MSVRLIVKFTDYEPCEVGVSEPLVEWTTLDVDLPNLEELIVHSRVTVSVVGAHVVKDGEGTE